MVQSLQLNSCGWGDQYYYGRFICSLPLNTDGGGGGGGGGGAAVLAFTNEGGGGGGGGGGTPTGRPRSPPGI